jgi:hypothetical protein
MSLVRVLPLCALAALSACGGSRSVSSSGSGGGGGGQYTAQVQGYLDRLESNARNQGFGRIAAGPVYGSLDRGARATHTMTVAGGTHYVLFGACDNDCTDVDLRIRDGNGNTIMQDIAVDDRPVLLFTARNSGKYSVEVIMARCSANPCRYGVQLMAR